MDTKLVDAHGQLVDKLRGFLDSVARADLSPLDSVRLAQDLDSWTTNLNKYSVAEGRRRYGRSPTLPSAGQATTPWYEIDKAVPSDRIMGRTIFGNFFLGGRGAAHGGSIPLLFDELFGWLANGVGMPASRTAYLTTQYRSVVPVGTSLRFIAWTDRVEGRKRFLRAKLSHGEVLCAEGEALFVTLLPGQP